VARRRSSHVDSAAGVGERLRRARVAAGLTQKDIAFEDCTSGYVSLIESGRRVPSLQIVRVLAQRVGVSESWLATGAEDGAAAAEPHTRLQEAELALRLGELDDAAELYGEVAAADGRASIRALAQAGLGQVAFARDDAPAAIAHLEAALGLDQDVERDPAVAETLGRAFARVGRLEDAIALFRRRLSEAQAADDPVERLRFAVLLANALVDASAFGDATVLLASVLEREAELDPFSLARVYWSQSRLHVMKRELDPARSLAARALRLLETTEHALYRSRAHQLMAFVELDAGNAAEALRLIRRGRELARGTGTSYDDAKFELEEARALASLGRFDEAASLAMHAAGELRESHPFDVGRSYAELARVFGDAGETARALELFELAIELLEERPNRFLADAYRRYGELLEAAGRPDEAFAVYKKGTALNAELDRLAAQSP
jgi:tetratricopeptide (TPR) repeat protein